MTSKRMKAAGAIVLLLLSTFASAEDEIKFLIAKIEPSAFAGTSISDLCYTSGSKYFNGGETIFITGRKTCSKYSANETFLEFAWKGEFFYIEENKISLTEEQKEKISSFSDRDWSSLHENGKYVSLIEQKSRIDKLLSAINSMSSYGAIIADWSLTDESEYTNGTGLKFEVLNPTKKTIKYLWITVSALNPVGDPFGGHKTLKLVGPIEPDMSGIYDFDYVWMSDMPSTAKIRSVKIQYMDGSVRNITTPDKMIFSEDQTEIYKDITSQ